MFKSSDLFATKFETKESCVLPNGNLKLLPIGTILVEYTI